MSKNKRSGLVSKSINQGLPNTKTVWGLTKEEIEFCAYLLQALALIALVIDIVYVAIAVKKWISSTGSGSQFSIILFLFVYSFIPLGFAIYGINYENRNSLIVFIILDVFSLFVYLFATINWRFLIIGGILVEILLIFQLILAIMLLMCLWTHNEIFKKADPKWMDKASDKKSLGDDLQSEVHGSSLDMKAKDKTKDDKQKDSMETESKNTKEEKVTEKAKTNQTTDSKTEDTAKNSSDNRTPKTQTEGNQTVISMETNDNKSNQTEQNN